MSLRTCTIHGAYIADTSTDFSPTWCPECGPQAKPFPKSQQLARGERKYRRKVASPKQWQAIVNAKRGSCRVCKRPWGECNLHHIVPRDFHGDDVRDNLVPLCVECHAAVTLLYPEQSRKLCASLTDAEYAYAVTKLGEAVFERVYGIEYGRTE